MATTIFSVNFNKQEASSTLRVLVYANMISPDDIQFVGYISLDNTIVQTCSGNIVLDGQSSNGKIPLSPFAFLTGVSAGAHNISFSMDNLETDNVSLTILPGATIEITELKQAAM